MEYFIETVEEKQKDDKKWKTVTLNGGSQTYERVSIWPDYEGYAAVVEGAKLVGEVYQKGQYWNFKAATKSAYTGGKTGAMTKVMETKAANISAAQDKKHDAIKMAGAQRDAVLMVTTFEKNSPFPTDIELKQKIEAWMKYFLGLQDSPFI